MAKFNFCIHVIQSQVLCTILLFKRSHGNPTSKQRKGLNIKEIPELEDKGTNYFLFYTFCFDGQVLCYPNESCLRLDLNPTSRHLMAMKCLNVMISFAVVKSSMTFICIVIDTIQVNSTTKRFYMAELPWSTQI